MKLKNLEDAVRAMREDLTPARTAMGAYYQVSYDPSDGEILMDYHVDFGQNEWTTYHDPDIVTVGIVSSPISAESFKDWIERAYNEHLYYDRLYKEECKRMREMYL